MTKDQSNRLVFNYMKLEFVMKKVAVFHDNSDRIHISRTIYI